MAINPVDHPGGAETTLLRLLAGLHGRGWELTVSTPTAGPLARQSTAAGYAHVVLPLGGIGARQGLRALASFPRARLLARGADVVYLNGGVSGRLLPAVGILTPARTVLHLHDMVEAASPLWRLADIILADSQAVADRVTTLNPALGPVVVYLPVDLDPPAAAAPWSPGGPVIGFVGRLEPRKGVLDLVRAAPAIRAAHPDARIVLIGDEPYGTAPDYTETVLREAHAAAIDHVPWVDNAPGLMRHLDVLVLPSHAEPFGTVLAEAMAVGTPVVATAVDGLPEVVVDGVTGRLVPPGDPARLAAAIAEVLSRRAEMGAAAREHARRFATEGYVDRVEQLLVAS